MITQNKMTWVLQSKATKENENWFKMNNDSASSKKLKQLIT